MKINKIKINSYGKIKNKEIKLNNNLNIIYGKNESGKSTILNFIFNILYGIQKNKNGKEISDYEKYKPWDSDEFSGKITYELDNKNKYEIYREFNKKNPNIFNEQGEEISNKFNINKKNGNEFFVEQTNIDSKMFLATSISLQQEVKFGKDIKSMLLQKISNMLETGQDNISYKESIDKLNKLQLEKIGTERTKERPINIINKKYEENQEKINLLKIEQNLKEENQEKINQLKKEINENKNKINLFLDVKNIFNKNEINNEKIKIKEKIIRENNNNKNIINKNINFENNNYNKIKNNKLIENKKQLKNKKIKKYNIILFILIIINLIWIYLIKNKIIKYLIAFIIPIYLIIYYLKIRTINKKIKELEKQNNNNIENNENEINKLKNQLNLLDNNSKIMEEQIEKEKNKNIYLLNIEKKKIFDKYSDIFNIEKINEIFNENDIDKKINILQTMIENSSNELTKLEIKQEEFEEQSSEIVRLEEEQEILGSQLKELKEKNDAIELVKETIEKAYEKLKENINPEFNKKLSENISKITNGKYNNILFNDEQGLIVELPNGNYVSADRLSIGTIDQIYLSLRLASIDEISNEKLPIILDEAFAYFDDIRLENIMLFLSKEFKDRQIIIFTCTTRELRILQNNNIEFNFIEL